MSLDCISEKGKSTFLNVKPCCAQFDIPHSILTFDFFVGDGFRFYVTVRQFVYLIRWWLCIKRLTRVWVFSSLYAFEIFSVRRSLPPQWRGEGGNILEHRRWVTGYVYTFITVNVSRRGVVLRSACHNTWRLFTCYHERRSHLCILVFFLFTLEGYRFNEVQISYVCARMLQVIPELAER